MRWEWPFFNLTDFWPPDIVNRRAGGTQRVSIWELVKTSLGKFLLSNEPMGVFYMGKVPSTGIGTS